MRIDNIVDLPNKCTGCMACVDNCPKECIHPVVGEDGFVYSRIDNSACVDCGKCYDVCPIEKRKKHSGEQYLYAAYSKDAKERNGGSSGGIFEVLARHFINQGYCICGAAFDGTELKHCIAKNNDGLKTLLKSKYVQSDTKGIYKKIRELLTSGEKVFFCGTPCQVSALINFLPEKLTENLFTADIICHGVPSQKTFNMYIETLEEKHKSRISDFTFRVKDNKYKHAHGYSYNVEKKGKKCTVNGIYTKSSYYNAFKDYTIFRDSCYQCHYATLNRVSDITLGDFWGIEKYDFCGNTDKGVSMVITNTDRGKEVYQLIEKMLISKEFPLEYGVKSNYCLTNSTKKPVNRDKIIRGISEEGYENTAKKYFSESIKYRIYWLIPPMARNLIRKLRR
ncbi:MAG: Coenzyme F420 hydrogenase/dehydrogenase, beta subunit C-terminal domain [Clostridia bacterium]|nr:Coenzyme F420 hydrogenase/dehydrogenase, beta subunit C-terminal domain [Clostridia bacterium]